MAPKRIAAALAAAAIGMTDVALAQSYPERTVEITVPSSPGATADLLGRVLADGLTQQLGRRFIIVNKAAASGVIGTAAVAQAKPDGYTLLHGAAVSAHRAAADRYAGRLHAQIVRADLSDLQERAGHRGAPGLGLPFRA